MQYIRISWEEPLFYEVLKKIENSYLKNENSCFQIMHERVLLEGITFVLIFWEDEPFQKSQKKENPCEKNEDSYYQTGIFWDIFSFQEKMITSTYFESH